MQAVTAGDAESGNFPCHPQSLAVCHRHFFRPEQRPAAVQGGNTHHLRFALRIPQGQAVTLRCHPVYHIAVMTACLRVPLLHHHPRSVHIPQITAPAVQPDR
ncbi:hypothetical protein DBZ47_25930 (plasmid) [Escherichia coli]|nr:hypothetical protein A6V00_28310 [Escherichia coli]PUB66846.1 hypothetical protein DBZ47_25930 [Escherichia coli]